MKGIRIDLIAKIFFSVLVLMLPPTIFGQAGCFTGEESKKTIDLINSPVSSAPGSAQNEPLRLELLKMRDLRRELDQKIIDDWQENQKLVPGVNQMGDRHFLRLCEAVRQYGWTTAALVGEDGAAAALFLLRSSQSLELQREMFPVAVAAAKKGYVGNDHIAWLVDGIRVKSGLPQLFGTQTRIRDEIFYLHPLQNEEKVDEWRKMYNLPPLAAFIKYLQLQYRTVVLKSPRLTVSAPSKDEKNAAPAASATADPLLNLETEEVVKIDSNLVNINVRVSSADAAGSAVGLQKNDFVIAEDGKEQEIEFFSSAETPFDLILLLDLSGSTADKQDLIRKSTRRFIEAARPADRIAIVTFTNEARIVADLTGNRDELLRSVKRIDDRGGSGVWGALQFVFNKIIKPQSQGRRSAVLIMTDGVDSSLFSQGALAFSYPTFSDLIDTVRDSDTAVIPIYLDTELGSNPAIRKSYRTARRTLTMLAEESGSQMFYAKKVNDLSGIYEKIISDLGKIYSLGYQSTNEKRDGSWRKLTVSVKNHPNLAARAKAGYYAK